MTNLTRNPAFPAGSQVRDRLTGDVFTVAPDNRRGSYTTILIPGTDDRTMILPTGDFEAVQDAGTMAVLSPTDPFAPTAQVQL